MQIVLRMWKNYIRYSSDEQQTVDKFHASRLFKIFTDSDVDQYPQVQACRQNKRMVLTIDDTLIMLEDENVAACTFCPFKTNIDGFCLSQSGEIVVCLLSSGDVHGIHNKGVAFNFCVYEDDINIERTFVGVQQHDNSFYILCCSGTLYKISNVDEAKLEGSIYDDEGTITNRTLLDNVSFERIFSQDRMPNVTAFIVLIDETEDEYNSITLISSSRCNLNFQNKDYAIVTDYAESYNGIKNIFNLGCYILALSNSGHLFEICPLTKLSFESLNSDSDILIDNLVVMECNQETVNLLILTKNDPNNSRTMKLIDFPSFNCLYEIYLPDHVWLVHQPKNSMDLYYLSGGAINSKNIPQEIEMKLVSETQPEDRLKKLIINKCFDEAEHFAKTFDLSLQPINEARVKKLLTEISSLSQDNIKLLNEKFDYLITLLKSIENKEFFVTVRFTEIPDRNLTEIFLNEVLNHLQDEEKYEQYVLEIKEQKLRLETLRLIDPYERNVEWLNFIHHPNMIKVVTSYFKTEMLTACFIWKRHASSIVPQLDIENVEKLLNIIPPDCEPYNIIQWLRHFIPSIICTHPNAMPFLTQWCIEKSRSLQASQLWPEIGYQFSLNITRIFEDIDFLYSDVHRRFESSMEKLKSLEFTLQELTVLKEKFNITLKLDDYTKDSLDITAMHILEQVNINKLNSLVTDFLYPLYMEKGMSPFSAIKQYIKFLVTFKDSINGWLERAVVSIDLLHNEQEKLECALLVLRSAPVPWPETIQPLIKLRNSSHPLALEIFTEFKLQTIKILKIKYGWPVDSLDAEMKLVFRIIKCDYEEMVEDIKSLVKALPELSSNANFYCCYTLVKKGQIENALKFLDDLDEKQRNECYEKVKNILMAFLEEERNDGMYFIEFLRTISHRMKDKDATFLDNFKHIQVLRQNFNLKVTIQQLSNKHFREKLLKDGIDYMLQKMEIVSNKLVGWIWKNLEELVLALNLDIVYAVIIISKKMKNLRLTCALAYYVDELVFANSFNSCYFIELAALLISQQTEELLEGTLDFSTDPLAYPLSYKILVNAFQHGKIHQPEILELLRWVRIANNVYSLNAIKDYYSKISDIEKNILQELRGNSSTSTSNKSKRTSISIFEKVNSEIEYEKPQIDPIPVMKAVCYSILIILLKIKPVNSVLFSIKHYLNVNESISIDEIVELFLKSLTQLSKLKYYNSWYTIVQNIRKLQDPSNNIIEQSSIALQGRKMFRYFLAQKESNLLDLFSMLISETSPKTCINYLANEVKNSPQKINLLKLSEMYHRHTGDAVAAALDKECRLKYYYYNEMCKKDASLRGQVADKFISRSRLEQELKNKALDINLIEKLCKDFEWNYQEVLVSQIVTVLRLQEPFFEIKPDALGKEEMVMQTTAEEILEICQPYITRITDTTLLATKLLQLLTEVNYYFYELYITIIDILIYINGLPMEMEYWKDILVFLKHKMITKRRQKAGQMETDWWLKSSSEVGVLPKIAKYRFPFMPIVQEPLKNILDDEVCVDNCESWFPLIRIHTTMQGKTSEKEIIQMQEYFCMSAVKNSISEYKQQNEDKDEDVWHLHPINNAFLQSILRLVNLMKDLPKIILILYFVTNHAPDGADQVEAAYECYKFALKHESKLVSIPKAQETVSKIKRKYPIFKTQHLLHLYGLVEDKLLQLVENPRELIIALYLHKSILVPNKCDVNKVATEIAELHEIDLNTLQISLLQKWLCFNLTKESTDLEETLCDVVDTSYCLENTENDEFAIRAHYILKCWEPEKAIQFLISHIFSTDGAANTGKQLQVFECFIKLMDESNASYTQLVNQKQYIIIKCIHSLRYLGYNFTIDKFEEYDKLIILKTIWKNHATNKNALELIAYICLGFDIYIPQIWNSVLKQMANLNMVKELNSLVDMLSCKPSVLHTEGLEKAWECVLRSPFKIANSTRSSEQEQILYTNLFRIQSCPVVTKINLLEIAEDCIRLDRTYMAAILMAFSDEKQREIIKKMVMKNAYCGLRSDILKLEEVGLLPGITSYVVKILDL